MRANDLTGKRFDRLTAICRSGHSGNKILWLCKCDCGKTIRAISSNLTRGHTLSCGCYKKEKTSKAKGKHFESDTRLYCIWLGMKERCFYRNSETYKDYGERGISVCNEWLGENGFENFSKWAKENGFDESKNGKDCSIDRIDVNGNYEPSNCRWVTIKEQANNKTNNFNITYKGETKTLAQWAEDLDLPYKTLYARIHCRHWDVEEAFERPIGNNGGVRKVTHNKGTY